jgi:hypothetical protein
MTDESDKRERQTVGLTKKGSRQDRLKLALRENLKRRKSQARGRGDVGAAPSNPDAAAPHDGSANKRGE